MTAFKTIFAYLFFVLAAVLFFLYVLFPGQAVEAFVAHRLAAVDPALSIDIGTIRPTLAAGLKTDTIDIDRDGMRLIHLDAVRVIPDLMKLLNNRQQGRFQARWAQGEVNGRVHLTDGTASETLRLEIELADIRLEKMHALGALHADERFSLTGGLTGRITHDGGRTPAGMTNGALTVADMRIGLSTPIAGIADVAMDQTVVEFSINAKTVQVKAMTFDGPMAEGKISGSIQLKRPIGNSRLNLSGNAKPRPELIARLQDTLPAGLVNMRTVGTRGVPFRVGGTIDNPDISMR